MNDNDLERRLRSETGPREGGYRAVPLPDAPDSPARASKGGRLMQAGLVLATVGAGVVAVLAASALMSPDAPNGGVGAGGTSTPQATATPREPAACQPADLGLTAEPWGGAAGSRGTVVTISLADGRYACYLQRHIGGEIWDADGKPLVGAYVPAIYDPVPVNPNDVFTVGVSWSNWCGDDVAEPVALRLSSDRAAFPVEVPDGADPVPPCMGENQDSTLNVTELQPAP
jgi:hypothetical protein